MVGAFRFFLYQRLPYAGREPFGYIEFVLVDSMWYNNMHDILSKFPVYGDIWDEDIE